MGGGGGRKPLRINDNDAPAPGSPLDDRMIPVVEVNRDGVVGVAWYDRRRDDTRRCWELFFTSSSDGGETFGANVTVATAPSCPPPAHAPVARVHNLAADPDIENVSDEELAKMDLLQRMTTQMAQQGREARARFFGDTDHASLEVTFDNARGNQPGHYLGLGADANGVFHPLWISRRNAVDELFTTTVEVAAGAPAAPEGGETDITAHLLVVTGPVAYDAASGKATLDVQLRNVSDGVVHGPVLLRAVGDVGREWSFTGKMGSHDRLPPGGLSEPVKVEIETGAGGGRTAGLPDLRTGCQVSAPGLCHIPWLDHRQRIPQPPFRHREFVAVLQVHPTLRIGAEVPGQAQSRVGRNAPPTANNFVDSRRCHADCPGESGGRQRERLHEIVLQHFPGMHGTQASHGSSFSGSRRSLIRML